MSGLARLALFAKIHIAFSKNEADPEAVLPSIEDFVRNAPKDPRCPNLFYTIGLVAKDARLKDAMEDRIIRDYPESTVGPNAARRKARSMIGKPFELSFKDAISGKAISIEGRRGKVVVIDFWSTTCGPCVEELPSLKATYAKYKDKGVEFISVSLDRPESEGGLEAVKAFVAKNEVPWPHRHSTTDGRIGRLKTTRPCDSSLRRSPNGYRASSAEWNAGFTYRLHPTPKVFSHVAVGQGSPDTRDVFRSRVGMSPTIELTTSGPSVVEADAVS